MRSDLSSTEEQPPVANRGSKSILVAYVLWLLTGILGGHQAYLDRPLRGALYFGLSLVGSIGLTAAFLLLTKAGFGGTPTDLQVGSWALLVGMLSTGALVVLLLWDLFTLPLQLERRKRRIQRQLRSELGN